MVKTIYNGEYEKKAITDQFVENLGEMLEKDPDVIYLDADLMFAFGAGLGSGLISTFKFHTIWFSSILLFVSFLFMFIKEETSPRM